VTPQPAQPDAGDLQVVSAENPWPGLLSFREADQRWFQGRHEETAELLQHVKRERLTILFALSGIGKSSLLQAGLFPALRREDILPIYVRLDYAARNPDLAQQVFDTIAQSCAAAGVTMPPVRGGASLWEYFHHVETEFWNREQRRVLPLVIFDQFEEIFTLGKSEDRSQSSARFLEELADLAEGVPPAAIVKRWSYNPADRDDYLDDGEYKILISLREDFLPELSDQRRRIAGVPQKRYRLRQMNGEGALLAVSQAKDLIDETVAAQVVRYVAAGDRFGGGRGLPLKDLDVEPALLSVVCRELNSRRRDRGEGKISADLLEGSQEQVLNEFYIRALAGMSGAVRTFVEEQLITVAGARNSVALDDALAAPGMSAAAIEELVERRLLRKEYRRNEVRIELTHDLLTGVVRASRDVRRTEEAIEKQRREREEALAQLHRSRKITLGIGAIAAAAAVAAVIAFQQRATAREQTARAVEAQRLAAVEQKRATDALAQATEAAKIAREKESERAQEAARADEEAKNAVTQAEAAKHSAQLAKQSELVANQQRNEADTQRRVALQQQLIAQKNEKAAADNAVEAQKNQQAAEKARSESDSANQQLAVRNDQIQREVSKSLVSEAAGLISTRQFARAMGDVARALVLDSSSLAAKSLAFDQLVRGGWRSPADSGAFVHPAMAHPGGVLFAAFSPDGRRIATTAKDNKVRVWDWQAGTAVELGALPLPAATVVFSPDGQRVATASYDQTARVWDAANGAKTLELKHASRVTSAIYSRDGRRIVTASQDKTAQVWDAATGAKIGAPLQHAMTVNFAAFSPDGARVVTACADGQARVWDLAGGRELFHVQHQAEVRSAQFSNDGSRLVTASADGTARVWDAASQFLVGDPMQHGGVVYFAAFSNDGRRVATASKDQTARVWEAATGRPITAPLQHKSAVLSAAFSADGRRLVTASDDKSAQVWEVWYDFESTADLVKLLEGVSGYDGSQQNIPQLPGAEGQRRITELRTASNQQPATSFLRWFFAHRQ
jgi:WD40 repeat protein